MGTYIPFTDEQKNQAASVNLEQFLLARGEKLLTSGHDKRLASDHSVTIHGCEWFDHATCEGGHAVSFVQRQYRMNYPDAVQLLLGETICPVDAPYKKPVQEEPKNLIVPEANKTMRRVLAYLVKQRNLNASIVSHFTKAKLLYEDAAYHNAVFVGTDENGVPRHIHKRSTNSYGKAFRQNVEGSDPRYSFHHIGTDGSLYVFEAPIDLLSYISMHRDNWQPHSYVACCGTSPQPVLEILNHITITKVFLCLDNDKAGHAASQRMAHFLAEKGVQTQRLLPKCKDWNEDLCKKREESEELCCQTMY